MTDRYKQTLSAVTEAKRGMHINNQADRDRDSSNTRLLIVGIHLYRNRHKEWGAHR